jgi:hypothetical protein
VTFDFALGETAEMIRDTTERFAAERIAGSLADQGWRLKVAEMGGAQLVRFGRRVERITQAEETADPAIGKRLVGNHAGDASAHGFSAYN